MGTIALPVNKQHNQIRSARLRALADRLLYLEFEPSSIPTLQQYIQEAIDLHPESTENYILIARTYQRIRCYNPKINITPQTLDALKEALQFDPKNTEVRKFLAGLYIENGNYQLALETVNEILTMRVDSTIHEMAGLCQYYLKNIPTAFEEFTRALELQPRNHSLHINRGHCFLLKNEPFEAYKEACNALLLKPGLKSAKALKKEAGKILARAKKVFYSTFEKEFEKNHLEELKRSLYVTQFEVDSLTKFNTDGSMQLWFEQTAIKNVTAFVINIADLRERLLLISPIQMNEKITELAQDMQNMVTKSLFAARPRADKLVAFSTEASLDLTGWQEIIAKYQDTMTLGYGVANKISPAEALTAALKKSVEVNQHA